LILRNTGFAVVHGEQLFDFLTPGWALLAWTLLSEHLDALLNLLFLGSVEFWATNWTPRAGLIGFW
jgi:hypothetical protein